VVPGSVVLPVVCGSVVVAVVVLLVVVDPLVEVVGAGSVVLELSGLVVLALALVLAPVLVSSAAVGQAVSGRSRSARRRWSMQRRITWGCAGMECCGEALLIRADSGAAATTPGSRGKTQKDLEALAVEVLLRGRCGPRCQL